MKVHHTLIDGVGGLATLACVVRLPGPRHGGRVHLAGSVVGDGSGAGAGAAAVARPARRPSIRATCPRLSSSSTKRSTPCNTLSARLGRLAAMGTSVARLMAPAGRPVSPIMHGRSFRRHVEVVDVPLADLKRAARGWQGTLNDVFVASVVRGLARYHEQHGVTSTGFRALMPVNVRHPGDRGAGNHFVPARFVIPVHADLGDCVAEVQRLTGIWKNAPGLAHERRAGQRAEHAARTRRPRPVELHAHGQRLLRHQRARAAVPCLDRRRAGSGHLRRVAAIGRRLQHLARVDRRSGPVWLSRSTRPRSPTARSSLAASTTVCGGLLGPGAIDPPPAAEGWRQASGVRWSPRPPRPRWSRRAAGGERAR